MVILAVVLHERRADVSGGSTSALCFFVLVRHFWTGIRHSLDTVFFRRALVPLHLDLHLINRRKRSTVADRSAFIDSHYPLASRHYPWRLSNSDTDANLSDYC